MLVLVHHSQCTIMQREAEISWLLSRIGQVSVELSAIIDAKVEYALCLWLNSTTMCFCSATYVI